MARPSARRGRHDNGAAGRVAGIDTDRIKGVGRQIAGAAKQGFGSLTGNARMVTEGSAERAAGKARNERERQGRGNRRGGRLAAGHAR